MWVFMQTLAKIGLNVGGADNRNFANLHHKFFDSQIHQFTNNV